MVRALRPLAQAVRLMVGRALVHLVDDATRLQSLQVGLLADEVRNAERFQQYGFTSHPQPGAEAVAVCAGGARDHVLVIAVDDRRYRLRSLAQGEVALYTDEGDRIHLQRGGIVRVQAATKVIVDAPTVQMTGDLAVGGNVTAGGDVADHGGANTMAGMRTAYNDHRHAGGAAADSPM